MAKKRTNSARPRAAGTNTRARAGDTAKTPGDHAGQPFPIVAVGASAGGLDALTALLGGLPSSCGMAVVLIQHLEPKHESALTKLLSKATSMPVVEVSDGLAVEPNHVYVIPPNKDLGIRRETLRLAPRSTVAGLHHPIDTFLVALAEERGNRAIGVVLSGTGSDGTLGLKAIKAAGGISFAQDPKTAQWPAMPMSAIAAGTVDFILSPKRIAAELARIGRHPYFAEEREVPEGSDLDKICTILLSSRGVDFRLYKQATVRRRIARRMALRRIESLREYAQFLKKSPEEAEALAGDIYILVTRFFRDTECFQALRKQVLSKLRLKRPVADAIRIWVAGCSTGEEVYSIAILLFEELGAEVNRIKIQIFGTDIQERAVAHARAGNYAASAIAGVSSARLKRFFEKTDQGYRVSKLLREVCIFTQHDLAKDPPFSRLDLISCRNVLIYLGPALQKRILSAFQYALKPGGYLFLGNSESISEHSDVFTAEDWTHRIFSRKPLTAGFDRYISSLGTSREPAAVVRTISNSSAVVDFRKETDRVLLEHYMPPVLVVDSDLHIVHFRGDTSPYLAPAEGQASLHLLKMVRPEIVADLRMAIQKARKDGAPVQRDGVRFEYKGRPATVRLEVRPLQKGKGKKSDFLVVFQEVDVGDLDGGQQAGAGHRVRAGKKAGAVERELAQARMQLRTLVQEHEVAQEEMKAANEEALSSNEELQSTNEELETAKEELQSSNEELATLNEELQRRNADLNVLSQDLGNLLEGIDTAVLVLDDGLRVRRFTPTAGVLLNLIPGDVGRPFSDITSNLQVADWNQMFSDVARRGRPIEREVRDQRGYRYSMRMRPYLTGDDKLAGVLVVLLDTNLIQRARDESTDYARLIVETIDQGLVVVDSEFRVLTVNRRFCEIFRVSLEDMKGQSFFGAGKGQIHDPQLRQLLGDVLSKSTDIDHFELDQEFPEIGRRRLLLDVHKIEKPQTILIAIEDLTERKHAQEELETSESTVRALLESTSQSIIAVNSNGEIVLVNGSTEVMFGYKPGELRGQPLDTLIPENSRGRHAEHRRTLLADMRTRLMDMGQTFEGRRKDGTNFPVEIGLGGIETTTGKLAVAFVSDITERKRVDQALRESEERFRRVFEEGPLGLALVGRDYRFLKVNSALCQMVGYSEAELTQLSFPDITHPDDLPEDTESAKRLFEGAIPFYQMQKRYLKKHGEIIWINLTASVIRDSGGKPLYGLAMVEDITAVRRTQEESVARQKLESLGGLARGVAHDFNNLLGAILTEAELAEQAADLFPREEIAKIKMVAMRGAEIVRELMIYAGQDQAGPNEPVDLSLLVNEILELLKVSVSKHVVLKVNFEKNLPAVLGNAPQIRQVVMNLVINASEAIGEKEGVIQISLSRATGGEGSGVNDAPTFPTGDYVRLEVSDTGSGMTEEVKSKLFDPFFSTKFAGRGLGLAIVQRIVRDHHGALNVVSAPGQGATFQVFLPSTSKRDSRMRDDITSSGAEQPRAQTGTILIVEDEEALRLSVSKALRKRGFSVLEASDGSAAIDLFHSHKEQIDVMLLDVTLPGKSSREVFEEALRVRPSLKVILTSAYGQAMVAASFPGLRVTHFIRKPFQLRELAGMLQDILSARALSMPPAGASG